VCRVVGAAGVFSVKGNLVGAGAAPEVVDAGVAGDLVDPGPEGDGSIGLAHAPKRGEEDLLGDVLGPAVIAHHPADERRYAAVIARVELLEGVLVARPHGSDQRIVVPVGAPGLRPDQDEPVHRTLSTAATSVGIDAKHRTYPRVREIIVIMALELRGPRIGSAM